MKQFYTLFLIAINTLSLQAQTDLISTGASYSQQSFYTFEDGQNAQFEHTTWDIAFSIGGQDLGIFVNEAAESAGTEVELYLTTSTDFAAVSTDGMTRLYNDEIGWSEGAFNSVKDAENSLDYGWGTYDFMTHVVNGTRVFVINLRNGDSKKLFIESLASGTYTFRYADLDGSNEQTQTVKKADFADKTLAYFSFETNEVLDLEPEKWDFQFTRYVTPLDDGEGGILDYNVTGILTNAGIEVAIADGIDPNTVDYRDYVERFSNRISTIGHDWKYFNLDVFQWEMPTDRVYFVKTADDMLWQAQFIDFEGSSTGTAALQKTFLTEFTSIHDSFKDLQSFEVFPNPTTDVLNVAFELNSNTQEGIIQISNSFGQVLQSQNSLIQSGLNVHQIYLDLPAGLYQLSLQVKDELITQSFFVR